MHCNFAAAYTVEASRAGLTNEGPVTNKALGGSDPQVLKASNASSFWSKIDTCVIGHLVEKSKFC